jgi:hypothetical protein
VYSKRVVMFGLQNPPPPPPYHSHHHDHRHNMTQLTEKLNGGVQYGMAYTKYVYVMTAKMPVCAGGEGGTRQEGEGGTRAQGLRPTRFRAGSTARQFPLQAA